MSAILNPQTLTIHRLPKVAWTGLCKLCLTIPRFNDMLPSFTQQVEEWRSYCNSPNPQLMDPCWAGEFTHLQKILLLRALRPEKVTEGIQLFVIDQLGNK